jgi:hypothetical protein
VVEIEGVPTRGDTTRPNHPHSSQTPTPPHHTPTHVYIPRPCKVLDPPTHPPPPITGLRQVSGPIISIGVPAKETQLIEKRRNGETVNSPFGSQGALKRQVHHGCTPIPRRRLPRGKAAARFHLLFRICFSPTRYPYSAKPGQSERLERENLQRHNVTQRPAPIYVVECGAHRSVGLARFHALTSGPIAVHPSPTSAHQPPKLTLSDSQSWDQMRNG